MAQMKEHIKNPEKKLNKMEISNLSDTKFQTLVIRMLNELKGRVDELRENFNSITKAHGNHKKELVRNEGYMN